MTKLTKTFGRLALANAIVCVSIPSMCGAVQYAQWVIDYSATSAEKQFETAPDWFDANNWTNGLIASAAGMVADFWPRGSNWDNSGLRYVKLDRDITVARVLRWWNNTRPQTTIDANNRVLIGGDHTVTLDAGAEKAAIYGMRLYAGVRIATSAAYPLLTQVEFCGPVSNDCGYEPCLQHSSGRGYTRFRRDLWADGTSEGITNFAFSAYRFDDGTIVGFYAPEGSDGATGTWRLTEGSPFAYRLGDAHVLSAGATVAGDGVPAGAYVKRIYSDSIIELSAAAEASSPEEGTPLNFGAFRPKAYQRIDRYSSVSHSSGYYIGFWPMKHGDDDGMTVEMFDLVPTSGTYHFYVDCEEGYLPGRFVFHNTSLFNRRLMLGTCDVEFAATTNGTPAGFPNAVIMSTADDVAKVTVPEGVEATFGALTNVVGTFVKLGAGSLAAAVTSDSDFAAADSGALSVQEGHLTLTCGGGTPLKVASLAVAAGATLTIPECGLEVGAIFAEPGATIDGSGVFHVVETNSVDGIAFGPGVKVRRIVPAGRTSQAANFYWKTNVTAEVVGDPAYWFDATKADSFEFDEDATSRNYEAKITKWIDARGAEYGCATCFWASATTPRSQVVYTNGFGKTRMVLVWDSSSTSDASRNVLQWDRRVTGIRSVFKVVSSCGTTGIFLGGSNLRRGTDRSYSYSSPLFYNAPAAYTNGLLFYANGERRDWRDGYPYGSARYTSSSYYSGNPDRLVPLLAELHFPDDATYASNFGYNDKPDNGRDYICECLIYTNELTEVERLSVRKYLMQRWFGGFEYTPVAFENMGTLDVGAGMDYSVGEGEALTLSRLTGDGEIAKYGAGTLAALTTASNSLHVAEGVLSLRSRSIPPRDGLPGDPFIHLDASDADSLVVESGKVESWADVRGEGHLVATALNSGYGPTFEENAVNGMPAIDFGNPMYQKVSTHGPKCPTLVFEPTSNAYAMVAVMQSISGGGPLLGWHVQNAKNFIDNMAYGLWRNLRSNKDNPDNPIIYAGRFATIYFDFGYSLRPGGARVRLNGEEVDGISTPFTHDYDLVSLVGHRPICTSALGQIGAGDDTTSYFHYGGYKMCEVLIYTNLVSCADMLAVEAYLNKKWFNRVPEGYGPLVASNIVVDAGATLDIYGNVPIAAKELTCAGTVSGSVSLAPNAVVRVPVGAGGVVPPLDVTGGITLEGGGTVTLEGDTAHLQVGTYPLCAVNGSVGGVWSAVAEGFKGSVRVVVGGGVLSLDVLPKGTMVILR